MIDGPTLHALTIWSEASGESLEGKAAVSRVIDLRTQLRYESDGTEAGTCLAHFQFSGFWFSFPAGHYKQVSWSQADAMTQAQKMLAQANGPAQASVWRDCQDAIMLGRNPQAFSGPQWQALVAEPRALMYCNLDISHPAWATPAATVAKIGHHTFFRA